MTRALRFTVTDPSTGKEVGGWHRPRGATPAHRSQHLQLDRNLIDWHRTHGNVVTLERLR